MLPREELIEQAYFFRILGERIRQQMPSQDVLASIKEEVLATTDLPKAIDFLAGDLRLRGVMAPAMARLGHYFTPFQTFVIAEGESVGGPIPPTGNTNTRGFFQPDVRTFLKRWVAEGPTHHFAQAPKTGYWQHSNSR